MEADELRSIVEALLFASDSAISIERLAGIIEGIEKAAIREAIKELNNSYEERGGGLQIDQVAGGFQLRTRVRHAPWVKRLFKSGLQRVSRASMETLSIIAYKQPVTRAELESIRGVDSAGVIKTLLDKRLIRIVGRIEAPGRPVVYGTTKDFLEAFELKDLSHLPTLKDVEIDPDMLAGDEVMVSLNDENEGEENLEALSGEADTEAASEEENTEETESAEEALEEATIAASEDETSAEEIIEETESAEEALEDDDISEEATIAASEDETAGAEEIIEETKDGEETSGRKTTEDTGEGGDSFEAQGRGDDNRGEGEASG